MKETKWMYHIEATRPGNVDKIFARVSGYFDNAKKAIEFQVTFIDTDPYMNRGNTKMVMSLWERVK